MKQLKTVMVETYLRQIKSWAFLAMVFAPFLMFGLSYLIGQFTANGESEPKVALVDAANHYTALNSDKDFEVMTSEKEAETALKDKEIDGYITVDNQAGQLSAIFHGNGSMDTDKKTILLQHLQVLQAQLNQREANLTEKQTQTLARQFSFKEVIADQTEADKKLAKEIAFYVLLMAMYFLLLMYSSVTAQEIAGEKGTRIMEMIFSSVPAKQYFYGRILGLLGVIVTHIGIYVLAGFALSKWLLGQDFMASFQGIAQQVLAQFDWMTILFILLGLLLYVVLSALCGALVSRPEDAGKAVQPLLYLIIFCLVGGIALGQESDGLVLQIGSYFPLTALVFMPIRLMNGWASLTQGLISLLILLITTVGVTIYIARNYAGLILQTDDIGMWKTLKRGLSRS